MDKDEIIRKFLDVGVAEIPISDNESSKPESLLDWQHFENIARNAIEKELGCILNSGKANINGKAKDFDLLNIDNKIVGDIKHYSMTSGGHDPSAKFSTLNEYAWLMQKLEQYQKQKWRKIFVIGPDEEVVRTYISRYNEWLDDIEIFFCSYDSKLKKLR